MREIVSRSGNCFYNPGRKLLQGEKRKSKNKTCRAFARTAFKLGQKIHKKRRRTKLFNCRKSWLCKLNGVLLASIAPARLILLQCAPEKGGGGAGYSSEIGLGGGKKDTIYPPRSEFPDQSTHIYPLPHPSPTLYN